MRCGNNAERNAEHNADEERQHRKLEGRREHVQQVTQDRLRRDDGSAEITVQDLHQIAPVLYWYGKVEADLGADAGIGLDRRFITHDREYRIDRDDAADEEGNTG